MNLIAKIALEEFHEKCTLQIIRRQVKDMATGQATHRVEVREALLCKLILISSETQLRRIKETRHIVFSGISKKIERHQQKLCCQI